MEVTMSEIHVFVVLPIEVPECWMCVTKSELRPVAVRRNSAGGGDKAMLYDEIRKHTCYMNFLTLRCLAVMNDP